MINVLLIDSKDVTIEAVSEGLINDLRASVTVFRSAKEAIEHLEGVTFDLVIVRNKIEVDGEEEDSARTILNTLYDQGVKTKSIVLGDLDLSGVEFESMPDRFRVSDLIRRIIKLFNISKEELAEMRLPDYVPIPLNHFYLMTTVPCDIFIRIEKKGSADSYIKRIHCGDTFDKEAINRYEENKVLSFYVEKDKRHLFLNSLVTQSLKRLEEENDIDGLIENICDSFQITRELLVDTGIDPNSTKLIDGTMGAMTKIIDDNPVLSVMLSSLLRSKGNLAYKHSHMIILFANKLICNLDWVAEEQCKSINELMVFVSFFHDVFLLDDHLQDIHSKEQATQLCFSEEEVDLVNNHANLAATMVQKIPRIPAGADIVIREHHGAPNGVGFVERYGVNVSKQAIAFIVLEDFAWRLIHFEKGKDTMPLIFEAMNEKFHQHSYREVIEALKKVVSSGD